jgi:LysM repeat protein
MNMPFRPQKKQQKLRAATTRRSREADFTEEPNVKLSSAFVVVLVLHVVAVGGIYAFNALKARQPPAFEETPQASAQPVAATQTDTQADAPATPAPSAPAAPTYYRVKSGDTIARIAASYGVGAAELIDLNNLRDTGGIHVGQTLKIPAGGTVAADTALVPKPVALKDSGVTYTVVRGDTPVSIARKLHVVFDDLMRLNKIEDPRKLKVGLKLKVPVRRAATSLT